MKLAQSLALIITGSASFIIPFALASSFQVVSMFNNQSQLGGRFVALPSNNFNCEFFQGGMDGAGNVSFNGRVVEDGSLPAAFNVLPGLCGGSQQLDLYQTSGTRNFEVYVHEGSGVSQATCYPDQANLTCSPNSPNSDSVRVFDQLICNSTTTGTICNSS